MTLRGQGTRGPGGVPLNTIFATDPILGSVPADIVRMVLPVGIDPSVAPGVPAPVGTLAISADGTHAWLRWGPTTTDWSAVSDLGTLALAVGPLVNGTAATGTLQIVPPDLWNNDTIIVGGQTFEWHFTNPFVPVGGRIAVDIVGMSMADAATAFAAAINGQAGNTVRCTGTGGIGGGTCYLQSKIIGPAGDVPITGTYADHTGMSGGDVGLVSLQPHGQDLLDLAAKRANLDAIWTAYAAGDRLRPQVTRGTFVNAVNIFDWQNLACDAKGGFRIVGNILLSNTVGSNLLSGRVNGSPTTNLAWHPQVGPSPGQNILAGYAGMLLVAGDRLRIRIECLSPYPDTAGRMIFFETMHVRQNGVPLDLQTNWTMAVYNGTNQIDSVGICETQATATMAAASTWSLERFP